MTPADPGSTLARDGGETRVTLGVAPAPWLTLEGGYTIRKFSSAAGRQEWKVPSAGARISTELGHPALLAFVRGHYLPPTAQQLVAGQAAGDAKWRTAFGAEAGVSVSPRRLPLWLGASYRLGATISRPARRGGWSSSRC